MSTPPHLAGLAAIPEKELSQLVCSAPMTDTVFRVKKEDETPHFEFGEHSWLGDSITLTWTDGQKYTAIDKPFTLPSQVQATYGQLNGLAGDFYATAYPISDGKDSNEQIKRFNDSWNFLAQPSPLLPGEAKKILSILQTEVDAVKKAIENNEDPSLAYSKLDTDKMNSDFQKATGQRSFFQRYYQLAFYNWDHFGADAHTAYIAGHTAALQKAKAGDLITAYSMNAFADHFLQDSFAAGHVRVPRRALHGTVNITYDLNAKLMHEEDGAIGLKVRNKRGNQWTAYGDRRLLDHVNEQNKIICREAVQASADEVYAVFKGAPIPTSDKFAFQNLVPILDDDVMKKQDLVALFRNADGGAVRRKTIKDRRTDAYTNNWTALGTYAEINSSGWWKNPIKLDGPGGKS